MPRNFLSDDERWQLSVRNYFSAVTHVDHYLGRVWDALKASRFADNTIVVILSDHGMHLGDRYRFRKTTLWEQVANIPFVIHDPTRPEPRDNLDPVAVLDVGPTLMDYAGLPPLEGCVGRSLRAQAEGASVPDRAVPTFHYDSIGLRKGPYRFIRYEDGSTEFYDVEQDWWQIHDLGPDHPDYAAMEAATEACALEYGLDFQNMQNPVPLKVNPAK